MLYIVKQYKALLSSFIKNELNSSDAEGITAKDISRNDEERAKYIEKNEERVKAYLLQIASADKGIDKEKLDKKDTRWGSSDRGAIKRILETLNIPTRQLKDGIDINRLNTILTSFVAKRKKINDLSKKKQEELQNSIPLSEVIGDKHDEEKVDGSKKDTERQKKKREKYENKTDRRIDRNSFKQLMLEADLSKFEKLETRVNREGETVLKGSARSKFRALLKGKYKKRGIVGLRFDKTEEDRLFTEVQEIINNQKEVVKNEKTWVDRVKYLVDFDGDGVNEVTANFTIGEQQVLRNLTQHGNEEENYDKFNILLDNLGMESVSDNIDTNLYSVQQQFKERLGRRLASGIPLEAMLQKGGIANFTAKQFELQDSFMDKMDPSLVSAGETIASTLSEKLKKPRGMDEAKWTSFKGIMKEKIRYQGLAVIKTNVGNGLALSANFDISKLTKKIIDTATIGVFNGMPGVSLAKNFSIGKRGNLTVGAFNFIPFAAVGYQFEKGELADLKSTFPTKVKGKVRISGNVVFTNAALMVSGRVDKVDDRSVEGISQMVEKMGVTLQEMLLAIENGEGLPDKLNKLEGANTLFSEMQELYTHAPEDMKARFLLSMQDGYLRYYQNNLLANLEGVNINGLSAGLAFLAGFYPIPFVAVHGSKSKISYEAEYDTTSLAATESLSKSVDSLGEEVKYKGYKVRKFTNIHGISTSDSSSIQLEVDTQSKTIGKDVYVGGQVSSFNLVTREEAGKTVRILVINDSLNNGAGLQVYPTNDIKEDQFKEISSSIEAETILGLVEWNKEQKAELKGFTDTKDIREKMNSTLKSTDLATSSLNELHKAVIKYKTHGGSTEEEFKSIIAQFNNEINNANSPLNGVGIKDFDQKDKYEQLAILQSFINAILVDDKENPKDDNAEIGLFNKHLGPIVSGLDVKRSDYVETIDKEKTTPKQLDNAIVLNVVGPKVQNVNTYHGISVMTGMVDVVNAKAQNIKEANIDRTKLIENIPERILEALRVGNESLDDVKKEFIKDTLSITFTSQFVKMYECFNDALAITNLSRKKIDFNSTLTNKNYAIVHEESNLTVGAMHRTEKPIGGYTIPGVDIGGTTVPGVGSVGNGDITPGNGSTGPIVIGTPPSAGGIPDPNNGSQMIIEKLNFGKGNYNTIVSSINNGTGTMGDLIEWGNNVRIYAWRQQLLKKAQEEKNSKNNNGQTN